MNQSDFDEKMIVLLKYFDNFIQAYNILRSSLRLPYVIPSPALLTLPSNYFFPPFLSFFPHSALLQEVKAVCAQATTAMPFIEDSISKHSSLLPGSPSLASPSSVMLPGLMQERALNWHLHTISSDSLS